MLPDGNTSKLTVHLTWGLFGLRSLDIDHTRSLATMIWEITIHGF